MGGGQQNEGEDCDDDVTEKSSTSESSVDSENSDVDNYQIKETSSSEGGLILDVVSKTGTTNGNCSGTVVSRPEKFGTVTSSHSHSEEGESKDYQKLLTTVEKMKQLRDSKVIKLRDLKEKKQCVQNKNIRLAKELEFMKTASKQKKAKLQGNLTENIILNQVLHKTQAFLKSGLQKHGIGVVATTEMLRRAIGANNCGGSNSTHSQSPSLTSTDVALCPSALQNPANPTFPQPSVNQPSLNIVKVDLQSQEKCSKSCIQNSSENPLQKVPTRTQPQRISTCLAIMPKPEQQMQVIPSSKLGQGIKKEDKMTVLHAVDVGRAGKGYFCVCGVDTTTKLGLNSHIQYHTYKGQFVCPVGECGKRHYSTNLLRSHMRSKHGLEYKGRNGCRRCGQTFLSRMKLYLHCKNVHNCGPLLSHTMNSGDVVVVPSFMKVDPKLSQVVKIILPRLSLNLIYRNLSVSTKPPSKLHEMDTVKTDVTRSIYVCICGRDFAFKQNLQMHIKYHTFERRFSCKVCGKKYNATNHLRQHMKLKHKMELRGHGCRACGSMFQSMKALFHHCKRFHNTGPFVNLFGRNNPKNVPITPTTSAKSTKAVAISRELSVISSSSGRSCKASTKSSQESAPYSTESSNRPLPILPRVPKPKNPNGIKCPSATSLKSRSASTRDTNLRKGQNGFECFYCPRRFPRRDILKKHVTSTHDYDNANASPKKEVMSVPIPKTFSNLSSSANVDEMTTLTVAKRTNVAVNDSSTPHGVGVFNPIDNFFKCLCGMEFSRSENIREHIHLKLELHEFSCRICKVIYWRQDYLKVHLERYHGVTITGFACRTCGVTGFDSPNDVKKHRSFCNNKQDGSQVSLVALP